MKLSILIPTLNEPFSIKRLARLNAILDPQIEKYSGQVEKVIHDAGRFMPTGTKRNELINMSIGDYFAFIDADDVVDKHYVKRILEGIDKEVDVVTFCGWMTTDGANRVDFVIKLGEKYEERGGKYYRHPNHLAAMRRDKVERFKFQGKWQGEDYEWSKRIHDAKVLKTEHHFVDQLYWYDYINPRKRV
jgi:glycosyltransferase involved in cell wall biosynthesis